MGKGCVELTRGLELRGREDALMTITLGLIIRGVSVETAQRTDLNCTSVQWASQNQTESDSRDVRTSVRAQPDPHRESAAYRILARVPLVLTSGRR